ncbi:outer membrane beta-barrel family protein [Marinilabilia sp.]|uniref:outer membrane beta-barrel family protein n=1 Tax=Marinilabilia sp. TaxID=2021252 RepID=UPI0025C0A45C|nr:outer membrane beta-barrel family protein [Marinilabilia sp.]
MTNRCFVILAILSLISISSYSQSAPPTTKGKITGKVIDAAKNIPLEFATISIFSSDSSLIDGGITDSKGQFNFNLNPGNYYVEVQFVSYQKRTFDNINIENRRVSVDLGTIRLEPSTTSLNEVTVRGEKSEMVIGVDRKIFNVGKDLSNTGNSAAEILDNIPTVAVDADGNISLRGSGGVRMLIDGKPSGLVNSGSANALQALQGNMIERIEVITNPSARYEAAGMVGIINIILKKDERRGVNGSFEASVATPERYQFGANINFRREKINYFFNYGLRYGSRLGEGFSEQYFPLATTPFHTQLDRDRERSGWSNNLRGGADFFINSTTTLTAAGMFDYDSEENVTEVIYQDYYDDNGTPGDLLEKSSRYDVEKETEWDVEFSLNLEKIFDPENKEHKLNAFAQYILDDESEDSEIEEKMLFTDAGASLEDIFYQTVLNEEKEENYLVQADYVYPFGNDGRFEAGARGEFRIITNPYEVQSQNEAGDWVTDPEYTNDFSYDENVVALYLQGANKWGPVSTQLGLRGEYTGIKTHLIQTDEENERTYFDFFPTIHTTYHFNNYNAWQISYSRRIDRPHFWHLNPFSGLSDSRNLRRGNPNLEPEYTDAYESGYVYTPGRSSYYAGVYYRYTTGVEERINFVSDEGITISEPRNLAERHAYGAEANVSVDPLKWWNLSGNVNFYRMQTEGSFEENGIVQDLESDTYSWDTRINSRMRWDNDLSFQTTFFYRGEQETTQGIRKPFYMMHMSLSKDVFKGNGTITLNVRDVLNSRKFRYEIHQPDLISTNEFRWSTREFRLSFIYRLNQNKRQGGGSKDGGDEGGEGMGF